MSGPTVFALASGLGRAGIAVVRVSGAEAGRVLCRLTGRERLPAPRRAVRARIIRPIAEADAATTVMDAVIDHGLVIWFPAPRSFTGEDVAEFHIHGGPAVTEALLEALAAEAGLRLAEPGEFSRRAFENGRMDLTEAEGLADLVQAETEAQRRQSLRQMEGGLKALYDGWRTRLIQALAHFEAEIDFAEEGLPAEIAAEARATVSGLLAEIAGHLADARQGERLRDGLEVVILGPPNAGKSSLLNMLARREAAIVSTIPGTTRDIVEAHLDLAGYPVVVADTAGLREAAEQIEAEGVRRALERAGRADLKILVLEAADWPAIPGELAAHADADSLLVLNKIDLRPPRAPATYNDRPVYALSVKTGQGRESFLVALTAMVRERLALGPEPALTRARHRAALEDCRAALQRFLAAPEGGAELAAEDLRLAARALGRITGRVDAEEILDVIFRDFCIGK